MAIGKLAAAAREEQRAAQLADTLLRSDADKGPQFNQPPAPEGAADDEEPSISEDEAKAKAKLRTLTMQLADVEPDNLPDHLRKIQVARLQWLLIHEMDSHTASPQTQRELNSLNKSITGKDSGDDSEPGETDADRADRAQKLLHDKFGIDPAGATRVVRALESVMSVGLPKPADSH